MLSTTAALVALGGATALALGGREAAAPFVLGGGIGLLYQLVLQGGVDSLGIGASAAYSTQVTRGGMRCTCAWLWGFGGLTASLPELQLGKVLVCGL